MEIKNYESLNRFQIVNFLEGNINIGIELGVAEGSFSIKMMKSKKFSKFYGVDSYEVFPHDEKEFLSTKQKLSKYKNYKLIKGNFKNILNNFPDNYFDFIYIDGFAHTGNESGQTLKNWFKKVKVGGIVSGDDYHSDWPIIKETIFEFCKKFNFQLCITNIYDTDIYSQYPSWFFFKTKEVNLQDIYLKEYKIKNYRKKNIEFYYLKYKSKLYYFLMDKLGKKNLKTILTIYKKILQLK